MRSIAAAVAVLATFLIACATFEPEEPATAPVRVAARANPQPDPVPAAAPVVWPEPPDETRDAYERARRLCEDDVMDRRLAHENIAAKERERVRKTEWIVRNCNRVRVDMTTGSGTIVVAPDGTLREGTATLSSTAWTCAPDAPEEMRAFAASREMGHARRPEPIEAALHKRDLECRRFELPDAG